ncbi:cytochrome c maturation protein CcmE [Patulibacter minatonensis]|uniref:cytochrome c maturation protein CcmE domain-containing protein n=1 Tax=Patulibacter minatonensis TaxID=298163 RepID=UPI000687EB12|nr:cytochrome c maturation protein CcmE [Patulibacter minatonensis]
MTRTLRLTFAIVAAVTLAGALLYTSFAGSAEARQPSQMASAEAGRDYRLTGIVVPKTLRRTEGTITFRVKDRKGGASVPVVYSGQVPDAFREGREVIVTVQKQGETFQGKPDSLITKCPSKFDDGKQKTDGSMEWRDGSDKVVEGK